MGKKLALVGLGVAIGGTAMFVVAAVVVGRAIGDAF